MNIGNKKNKAFKAKAQTNDSFFPEEQLALGKVKSKFMEPKISPQKKYNDDSS